MHQTRASLVQRVPPAQVQVQGRAPEEEEEGEVAAAGVAVQEWALGSALAVVVLEVQLALESVQMSC